MSRGPHDARWPGLALAASIVVACGGKVVVDRSGTGGAGGAGATAVTSAHSGPASTSASTSDASASATAASSTGSGGQKTLCFMGVMSGCTQCSADALMGGPCSDEYQGCLSTDCGGFGSCSGGCGGDQACCDKCAAEFPDGAKAYGAVFACVACEVCPDVCGDTVQPGFCP